jgi:calcineurin-like phosphoesterase
MNFLFLGDIMGRAGRNIVVDRLPDIIKQYHIDFVIANGENSAGGYGITEAICTDLYAAGVDVITSGNHIWDQKETMDFIAKEKRLLRPWNYGAFSA